MIVNCRAVKYIDSSVLFMVLFFMLQSTVVRTLSGNSRFHDESAVRIGLLCAMFVAPVLQPLSSGFKFSQVRNASMLASLSLF